MSLTKLIARANRFLRNVDEEVHLTVVVGLLEVAVRADTLEARLPNEAADIAFPQREHVQRVVAAVGERVLEAGQPVVDVLRFRCHLIAAVVVLVLRREAVIEYLVVVSLVENEKSVVAQRCVELRERLATILLVMQMRERVAEA